MEVPLRSLFVGAGQMEVILKDHYRAGAGHPWQAYRTSQCGEHQTDRVDPLEFP